MDIVFEPAEQEGTQAVASRWLCQPGDRVEQHQPILEVETDKVVVEVVAPAAGTLTEHLVSEGDALEQGALVARLSAQSSDTAEVADDPPAAATPEPETSEEESVRERLSPAVRKRLVEHGLEAAAVVGTGSAGRVTLADVERHLEREVSSAAPAERVPHSPMRRKIAAHMVDSLLHTAPHVTAVFEADLSRVLAHRAAHRRDFERQSVALTLTAYFIRAAVRALTAVPQVNARFHDEHLEIFAHHHIGIGTALGDEGLVVPVLRHAESLNLFGTAERVQELTEKARARKLSPADLEGGTFSVSNHGVSGSLVATPIIINQPQSAILGIGKLEKRVVVRTLDGEDVMAIRPMCYVSLTIDHRALDAHQTNRFLSTFVECLESWPAAAA